MALDIGSIDTDECVWQKDGNAFYLGGGYFGTVDFDPDTGTFISTGNGDGFIVKFDAGGLFKWVRTFGGGNVIDLMGLAIDSTGIYACGTFKNTVDFDPGPGTTTLVASGEGDAYILKLDTGGNLLWVKNIGGSSLTYKDVGISLSVNSTDNLIVAGTFTDTVDFDPGPGIFTIIADLPTDEFLLTLDLQGNFIRAISYNHIRIYDVAMDVSGNSYTTGGFDHTVDFDPGTGVYNLTATPNNSAGFLLKLDSSGQFVWAIGLIGTIITVPFGVVPDGFGNVVMTGLLKGTTDFDPGPNTDSLTATGVMGIFTASYRENSDLRWARVMCGNSISTCQGVEVVTDSEGNIFSGGVFDQTVDFDPGSASYPLTGLGLCDGFIVKLDSSGNFHWAFTIGSLGGDNCFVLGMNPADQLLASGTFTDTVDFDPGSGLYFLNGSGADSYMALYDPKNITSGVPEVKNVSALEIYPNPSTGNITVQPGRQLENATVCVTNSFGEEVYSIYNVTGKHLSIRPGRMKPGIYFVRVFEKGKSVGSAKLIYLVDENPNE